mmetsp:Transcript_4045/g.6067  ORF Transcript_4045/g.6067 Transcript_4045/m.6067 type:complete len:246 (+) Transcript_4045:103-840(+)|eukprot:CAMPEP_0201557522 /NCGR_PEP_ID=MMETSP0173_2-20130828/62362_1 /ASSEMBLY_ACC=CAM_ASM_000268 /TAXON_ID=218659 /ORGANISM="Vexillifera sp., Strain DIVA3 564/2" /LENGTH=245 /DNA_ID=CAMNT_0047970415 /DNA_START=94 /DNA_END=834 /DNA_ORIENTATION=+
MPGKNTNTQTQNNQHLVGIQNKEIGSHQHRPPYGKAQQQLTHSTEHSKGTTISSEQQQSQTTSSTTTTSSTNNTQQQPVAAFMPLDDVVLTWLLSSSSEEDDDYFDDFSSKKGVDEDDRANRLLKQSQKRMLDIEQKKNVQLLESMNAQQLDRYEAFRRSSFPRATIKKLIQAASGSTVHDRVASAMGSVAKVFVAEIVEEALSYQAVRHEDGALQPLHLREALRRLENQNKIPYRRKTSQLFRK